MIGETLKKLRTEAKISQHELGHILGVSQQAIALWEKGTRDPDSSTIKAIANYFQVTIDYLMGNSCAEDNNLRNTMEVPKETILAFLQKLLKETSSKKVVWMRFSGNIEPEAGINPVLSFYANVSSGFVFLSYKDPGSVVFSVQFSSEDSATAVELPYDPEIQKAVNELYNTVYTKLPSLENFFEDYISSAH